jgi:ABC-type transport system involved in cytochrome c biogenesis permease component
MIRDLVRQLPVWFRVWVVFVLLVGVASTWYAVKECGPGVLLLGDRALVAVILGMC